MKTSAVALVVATTLAAGSLAPSIAQAANARHPYRHVNHANDRGNRSGDAEVARLNQQQLDRAKTVNR